MDTNLIIPKNAKKMLLFLEDPEFLNELNVLDTLAKQRIGKNIYLNMNHASAEDRSLFIPFSKNDVPTILYKQLVGTHLLIAGNPAFLGEIKELAYLAGFSENEIQSVVLGPKEETVFCVKCYSSNLKQQAEEIHCRHCETTLQVSNHFSKRLNAYLGYIKVG
ncbi:dimethylamine monooxygenase subunit DmmA family protein [Neobacillus cucumis]|uniref:dimethylamine monooxygenase subunit DmmA family protein n=1 Tax=Neobacillus cucumis TaxID=1740721 RepID=UPI002852FD31|nr:dimethylamine monooxygenase subunit DmmA family protein [Neobacillus cucumis]MDR4946447.1 dimethylamine monooxygenase subunit DmmA family protein [Neobacillus cucumis]